MLDSGVIKNKEIININKDILKETNDFKIIARHIEKLEKENSELRKNLEETTKENLELKKRLKFKLVKYAYKITMLKRRVV